MFMKYDIGERPQTCRSVGSDPITAVADVGVCQMGAHLAKSLLERNALPGTAAQKGEARL
jgi:hypothetical protein